MNIHHYSVLYCIYSLASNNVLHSHTKAISPARRQGIFLCQEKEYSPQTQINHNQCCDYRNHRAQHHLHRAEISLPLFLPCGAGHTTGPLRQSSTGNSGHIRNGTTVIHIVDFFLLSHRTFLPACGRRQSDRTRTPYIPESHDGKFPLHRGSGCGSGSP